MVASFANRTSGRNNGPLAPPRWMRPASFPLDPSRLNDRPPFLDVRPSGSRQELPTPHAAALPPAIFGPPLSSIGPMRAIISMRARRRSLPPDRTPRRAPGNTVDCGPINCSPINGAGDTAGTVNSRGTVDYGICLRSPDSHARGECRDPKGRDLERAHNICCHV